MGVQTLDCQPTLEGERVLLRPLRGDDREALFAIASDPAVWEQHPFHDRWREDVFAKFFAEALASGGALAVIDRGNEGANDGTGETLIGSTRFQLPHPEVGDHEDDESVETSFVEIGWTFLAPRYWGKGINREMKRLMLTHAFQSVDRVDFRVGETNYRSRIALENIGAARTSRTDLSQYQGKRVLHLIYAITAEEFATGPLKASLPDG